MPAGVLVARTADEALALAGPDPEPFIVGGGEIYRLFLPLAGRIHLSVVDLEPAGDATFPEFGPGWRVVSEEHFPRGERNSASFVYRVYDRSEPTGDR
jgi:dihydrofolate reductase